MIETIEDLVENLRYRQTDKTYGQYIERLEETIGRWHLRHTKLRVELKEQLKKLPDRYTDDDTEQWIDELKEIINLS